MVQICNVVVILRPKSSADELLVLEIIKVMASAATDYSAPELSMFRNRKFLNKNCSITLLDTFLC